MAVRGGEGVELYGPASETVSPPEPDEAGPLSGTQPLRRSARLGSSAAPAAAGASLLAGTLNLLNTVVGGGILSLPFAFKSCGLVTGVLYQLVFGAMSWCRRYLSSSVMGLGVRGSPRTNLEVRPIAPPS